MGRFLCAYHGTSGLVYICPHIRKDIDDRVRSERIIRAVFPDTSAIEDRFKVKYQLRYCLDCAAEYHFPITDSEMFRTDFSSMYDNGIFHADCFQCLQELNY